VFRPVAIALLLAFCAGVLGCRQTPGQKDASPAARTTIEAVGPKGEVIWPFVFEWKATAAPDVIYRVTVYDVAERQLVEQDTRARRLDAPRDLQALLPSTRRLLWRVAVVDGEGNAIAQTPLIEFTVK
jgi:hypothetical protein